MFENTIQKLKVPFQAPLRTLTTEELLSDMTLKRNPEILGLLSGELPLTNDNTSTPKIQDQKGNVYSISLFKQQGWNRFFLRMPIEVAELQVRYPDGAFDVFERIKNGLVLSVKGEALSIYVIYDGELDVSFETQVIDWKSLHSNLISVKFVAVRKLLQLNSKPPNVCRIFLRDFFDLDRGPYGAAKRTNTNDASQSKKPKRVTVLFLAANPSDLEALNVTKELTAIQNELVACKFNDQFNIQPRFDVQVDDLQKQLLTYNPTVVHFSGHGGKSGNIKLQDPSGKAKPVNASAIAKLFKILKDNIRLVILNACYAEKQAALISNYIDCVIGMKNKVGDEAAINFSVGFYRALGNGRDLQKAFEVGCSRIDLEGLDEEDKPKIEWKNGEPKTIVLIDSED